jgi:hypothetical protein
VSEKTGYLIALFNSVSRVMHAERILRECGVPYKIVPVPKHISSDCGVCIRFSPEYRERIVQSLAGKIDVGQIRDFW